MNQPTPSIPGLSAWQNAEYQRWEFLMQQKSSMEMFEKLSYKCFDKCVSVGSWNGVMRTKHMEDSESKCMNVCGEKYMKVMQRVGFRLAEFQQQNPDLGPGVGPPGSIVK